MILHHLHNGPAGGLLARAARLAIMAGLAGSAPAAALDLQATPIRIALDVQQPVALLTLINRDAQEAQVQVTLQAWGQSDGADVLTPTREVLVNPPIFALAGGAQQIVRLALRTAPRETELSYRIIVQQLPQRAGADGKGVSTLLRLSIPVFVPPPHPRVQVAWQIRHDNAGTVLAFANTGNVHVQLRSLRLAVGARPVFDHSVNAYALPGASRSVPLDLADRLPAGVPIDLVADSDQGPIKATVLLAAPGHAGGGD